MMCISLYLVQTAQEVVGQLALWHLEETKVSRELDLDLRV